METLAYEAPSPLPNPFRTQRRIVGWVVVGLWALFFFFLWLNWHAGRTQRLSSKQQEAYLAPVFGSVIFALAFPIGYFILIGEARRVDAACRLFQEQRYLVRWRYRPEDWEPYARWCRGHAKGRARRLNPARPMECYVSTVAAYANGEWILWGTSNRRLVNLRVVGGGADGVPLMLEFSIAINRNVFRKHVLVPALQTEIANAVAGHILNAGHPGGSAWIAALRTASMASQLLR